MDFPRDWTSRPASPVRLEEPEFLKPQRPRRCLAEFGGIAKGPWGVSSMHLTWLPADPNSAGLAATMAILPWPPRRIRANSGNPGLESRKISLILLPCALFGASNRNEPARSRACTGSL